MHTTTSRKKIFTKYIYIIFILYRVAITRHISVQSKTNTKTDKRIENSHDVVLQLPHSIAAMEDSENSQLQSSPEMYSLSIKRLRMS